MRGALVLVAAIAFTPAAPRVVHAAPAAEKQVNELRARARKAFDEGRFDDAIALYRDAYERSSDAALLFNLGLCNEAAGHYPEAEHFYRRFGLEAPLDVRKKVPDLKERLERVAAKIATLKIGCNVSGARVLVDGIAAGTTGSLEPVRRNAGPVVVVVEKDGYQTATRNLELQGGQTTSIDVTLVPEVKEQKPVEKRVVEPRDAPPPASPTWPWIVGSAGIVALGASAYFAYSGAHGLHAIRDSGCAPACDSTSVDRENRKLLVADIAGGVGVVAIAVAGYELLTRSRPSTSAQGAASTVTASFSPTGAFAGLRLRF